MWAASTSASSPMSGTSHSKKPMKCLGESCPGAVQGSARDCVEMDRLCPPSVTVTSTREFQTTLVLNYLTAPNALVRTAVCASCAVSGVFAPVELLAKNAQVLPGWAVSSACWAVNGLVPDKCFLVQQCTPDLGGLYFKQCR